MSKVKSYLTTGEAAAIFDVDPDTVLRWIKSGEIPAIRTPGGHYRINRNVFLTKMIKDTTINEKDETQPTTIKVRSRRDDLRHNVAGFPIAFHIVDHGTGRV